MYTVVIFTKGLENWKVTTDDFTEAIKILREENTTYATIWRNTDNRMLVEEWK